jgi:hypothetical protein
MIRQCVLLLAAAAVAAAGDLKPFEMNWRPGPDVLADLSHLLDAPAGKHGFVAVRDGHLVKGNGERLRIWGVNFSFTASLPAKDVALDVATHLARFGVNCVRIHHLDWRAPRGIIDSKHPDSRHLDPDALDRLDFFIAKLKQRGIYTNLNLNVARAFQEADGVKDAKDIGYAKALTYFDPRIIELQKEYARTLLTHKNPYTGKEYRSEPAIATVEIVNENSLIESWVRGRLQGKGPGNTSDRTWVDIPASYERDLTALWKTWVSGRLKPEELAKLRSEAGEGVPRLKPAEFKAASEFRFRTEAAFYMDLEDRFFQEMYAYLKKEIGVKMPVAGTSVHSGGLTPYPLLSSTSKLDIVDAHTYWQHPRYINDPATGKRTGWDIPNTPSIDDPARSAVVTLSRAAVVGKPFMVSEVNWPYPNEYGSEGVPLIAAYASFLDWDAVYWYSFSHSPGETWGDPRLPGHFDIRQDPVKMTQWAAGALMFRRGDVARAEKVLARSYTTQQAIDSLRLPQSEMPFFTPGFASTCALVHGVRIAAFNAGAPQMPDAVCSAAPFVSDTREIRWQKGLVAVDSPRSQFLIGYLDGNKQATRNLSATTSTKFGALMLSSMDRSPIASASKLLLVAGARTGNQGMQWNEKRTTLTDNGKPGMMIETVEGTVVLTGLGKARAVEAVPLDGGGKALGAAIPAARSGSSWELPVGKVVTPWYLIRVRR